jgi:Uma2 family endonuclease
MSMSIKPEGEGRVLTAERTLHPDDLFRLPEGDHFELVDGHLVEKSMGALSEHVGAEILILIGSHARAERLGLVFGADAGYQCFADAPEKVRKPDVSFIAAHRLRRSEIPEGHLRIAPDLAVESVSRHEAYYEVLRKVGEYLSAGVRLVWVALPQDRSVSVYRADGSVSWLLGDNEISGEDVLPGFRCPISEFFPPPE